MSLNSVPTDKILDWSKLKAFADHKINVTEKLKFVSSRIENIFGKGENAGYQHFSPFPKMFSNASFLRVFESWDCVVKLNDGTCLEKGKFYKMCEKAEKILITKISLFPTIFLRFPHFLLLTAIKLLNY